MSDPVRNLQCAARAAANHILPGVAVARVIVVSATGVRLMDFAVPAVACDEGAQPAAETPIFPPGWSFADKIALFDGKPVPVAPSRVKLLRVLVEAVGKLSAKELARLAFDREADEENARYHVKALRTELAAAFSDFEGEIVPGDGGYRLVLR